jgi:hypothetical protein
MTRLRHPPPPLEIRAADFRDAHALGFMVYGALHAAPSSPLGLADLGDDLLGLGHDLVHGALYDDHPLYVATERDIPVAVARIAPREFVRGSHIGHLQLLVSLVARRQGVGLATLQYVFGAPETRERFLRLEMALSGRDAGSKTLLETHAAISGGPQWELARLERGGMRVDGHFMDLQLWVRDV